MTEPSSLFRPGHAHQPRQLAPGPSPTMERTLAHGESSAAGEGGRGETKKRVSMACTSCKKSKRKCSGEQTAPCENCRMFGRECIFDESQDQRRRVAAKKTADELAYHRGMCNDLLSVMRADDESHGFRLLELVRRDGSSPEDIRAFMDDTLVQIRGTAAPAASAAAAATGGGGDDDNDDAGGGSGDGGGGGASVLQREQRPRGIDVEGAPAARPQVMDIHFLCDEVLYRVPAQPWTSVTTNDNFVSHLVSLYFTWDYPFHLFLDRDVFLHHMARGDPRSDLCSPFLVNALLANACYFSDYSEAYANPGDVMTKGAGFLAEAERLSRDEPAKLSLAFLQGTLMLYVRYSIAGNDNMGYRMLHQAIFTGESLGLIGPRKSMLPPLTTEMDVSVRKTAWGLFHIDTIVHPNFLRPSLSRDVNVPRPQGPQPPGNDDAPWTPYPSDGVARPSHLEQYLDASCELCEIARDMSSLFTANNADLTPAIRSKIQEVIYDRLQAWHNRLPEAFHPDQQPPPYILLLSMRYHTLMINLVSLRRLSEPPSPTSERPQTPVSPPGLSPLSTLDPSELIQASARAISTLTRCHRREYGMTRAHPFALYAINLALFAMVNGPAFDILDPDFLSLASSFAVVAACSPLGRNLFYLFRRFVRGRGQGDRVRHAPDVADELRLLFDEEAGVASPWDHYAVGLDKLDSEHYHGVLPEDGEWRLAHMLDCYESLSVGKDEIAPVRLAVEF